MVQGRRIVRVVIRCIKSKLDSSLTRMIKLERSQHLLSLHAMFLETELSFSEDEIACERNAKDPKGYTDDSFSLSQDL